MCRFAAVAAIYCAFHSMAIGRDGSGAQMMSDYLDTLLLELAHYGDKLGKAPVSSVFSAAARQACCRPILWGAFWKGLIAPFNLRPRRKSVLKPIRNPSPEATRQPIFWPQA